MSAPIMAFGGRTNAELILACHKLLYLQDDDRVLDCTYHTGAFWSLFRPSNLVATDLDPKYSSRGSVDFRSLPFGSETFDAGVFDPPYQLNGTSTGKGPSAKDASYGVEKYLSIDETHELMMAGLREVARVVRPAVRTRVDRGRYEWRGGVVLVKCQDQVASGSVHWQTRMMVDVAEGNGLTWIDRFDLPGYRRQPQRTRKHGECDGAGCIDCDDGRVLSRQMHAARNHSTLLVFRKFPNPTTKKETK